MTIARQRLSGKIARQRLSRFIPFLYPPTADLRMPLEQIFKRSKKHQF